VTLVTSQIKEEDASEDIDDTRLFQLKSEKSERVLALIAAKERMILLMKYQDDLSIKEISEKLEIGESAVKMRVKRAKQKVICLYKEF
jgi:RNA polymerase sigma factor (sigma-70 family)